MSQVQLSLFGSKRNHSIDIEPPPPPPPPVDTTDAEILESLKSKMPYMNDPQVVKTIHSTTCEIAQLRSFIQLLGDRPDHETVDTARLKIAEMKENSFDMEDIALDPESEWVNANKYSDNSEKEEHKRELERYEAIVKADEMHEDYEKLLKEAERKLERLSCIDCVGDEGRDENVEEVDYEIVAILKEAEKGLEKVDLSQRKLRVFPEAFGKIRSLVALDLSGNNLEILPDSIAGLQSLEELSLSSNLLKSLPDSIGFLFNLKVLNVASNNLKAFPDSICHCRSLVELDASYNSLEYLPTNIGFELVNLIRLSLHYNKLRSLPTSICKMISLRFLDAHFNDLHGLPSDIGQLTNLEILNLNDNFSAFTELPDTFGNLINLRQLDLSNNQIHALPNTFGRLARLTKLNLGENPLIIPPMEVVNNGVHAVKVYMNVFADVEQKKKAEEESQGWLTRSTSAFNSWASSVTGYISGVGSERDPCLDENY